MNQAEKPLVIFEGTDIKGGDETVIYDLQMRISKGDFVYITGRVGSGKTSIIRTVTAENEKGQKFVFTEAVGNNVSELNDWIQEQIAANKTNPKLEYFPQG